MKYLLIIGATVVILAIFIAIIFFVMKGTGPPPGKGGICWVSTGLNALVPAIPVVGC
jgi:hypothetical protein